MWIKYFLLSREAEVTFKCWNLILIFKRWHHPLEVKLIDINWIVYCDIISEIEWKKIQVKEYIYYPYNSTHKIIFAPHNTTIEQNKSQSRYSLELDIIYKNIPRKWLFKWNLMYLNCDCCKYLALFSGKLEICT